MILQQLQKMSPYLQNKDGNKGACEVNDHDEFEKVSSRKNK